MSLQNLLAEMETDEALLKYVTKEDNKRLSTPLMSIQVLKDYCTNHNTQFVKDVDPLTLFDVIQAAHRYQMKNLMDLTCQMLVSMVKGKSVEEMRTKFIINQEHDWISNGKQSKSILREREKETFIEPLNFVYVQRSHLVTEALNYVYTRRWKPRVDYCIFKLLNPRSDEDLLTTISGLASYSEDQVLADRLKHDHVVLLFNILEQRTSRQDIQSVVLQTLSRVNFTAHEKAMDAARIQLLVKVINEKVFGTYNYQITHQAVFTLTNIAKALPKFVVDILNTDVLERVKRVMVARCTCEMVDNIGLFLAAVCRTEDLSVLNKVDLARITLQLLEAKAFSEHHIEQACYAFQYLTYGMELQIENLALEKLIENLIQIIYKPPCGNCLYPGYALGVFGNIAIWGSFDQIKILTSNSKFLKSLEMGMMAGSKMIQKEACQIISNIATRMEGLLEEMLTAGLIEALCGLLEKDEALKKDGFDVKMEAAWSIYKCIYGSVFSPLALHPASENENPL